MPVEWPTNTITFAGGSVTYEVKKALQAFQNLNDHMTKAGKAAEKAIAKELTAEEHEKRTYAEIPEVYKVLRLQRLAQPHPSFGCGGKHAGGGTEKCPKELHHHHDAYCLPPTSIEWAQAGLTGIPMWKDRG